MRYLKDWNIFESSKYSEMKADIMDICQELMDGRKIECDIIPGSRAPRGQRCDFMVAFFNDNLFSGPGFHITQVIDYLMRIKDYLGEAYGGCGVVFNGEHERIDIDLSDERLVVGELYGYMIADLYIYVKSNSVKESFTNLMSRKYPSSQLVKIEMTKRDVQDMLLELGDFGFEWSVNYSPLTQAGRDEDPKLVVLVFANSKLFDANRELFDDVVLRIKEFVKSSGYVTGEAMNNDYQSGATRDDGDYYKTYQLLIQ